MSELQFSLINGLMLGIEHISGKDISEDLSFGIVIDLLVIRLTYVKWNKED